MNDFEWIQVAYAFIGSFFGFGFAILAQKMFDAREEANKKKTTLENIRQELQIVKGVFSQNSDSFDGMLYYDTSVWAAIISTGYLLDLLKKEPKIYQQCKKVYNHILGLRHLEEKAMDDSSLDDAVIRLRKSVVMDIEEFEGLPKKHRK